MASKSANQSEMAVTERSCDDFLGGKVQILQPKTGFRAGVDAVFLAAATPAKPGQTVLELGCGVGTALLCLNARVGGLLLNGIEIQSELAGLANENAARNKADLNIVQGSVEDMPLSLRQSSFDHVITNPPYFLRSARTPAQSAARETALSEALSLADWFDAALRRLRPGGCLTVIQRAERVPDMLATLAGRTGAIDLLPLQPRKGRPARLVLLRAVKGAKSAFRLMSPITLHQGDSHLGDFDDYNPEISAVLRESAAFPWSARTDRA